MRAISISVLLHLLLLLSPNPKHIVAKSRSSVFSADASNLKLRLSGHYLATTNSRKSENLLAPAENWDPSVRQSGLLHQPKAKISKAGKLTASALASERLENSGRPDALSTSSFEVRSVPDEILGQYRLTVARVARQFKAYPNVAKENGWQGVVQISVSMPIGFEPPKVSLARSSGYASLDDQALEMLEHAVGQVALPEVMRGSKLQLTLPVEYRLRD